VGKILKFLAGTLISATVLYALLILSIALAKLIGGWLGFHYTVTFALTIYAAIAVKNFLEDAPKHLSPSDAYMPYDMLFGGVVSCLLAWAILTDFSQLARVYEVPFPIAAAVYNSMFAPPNIWVHMLQGVIGVTVFAQLVTGLTGMILAAYWQYEVVNGSTQFDTIAVKTGPTTFELQRQIFNLEKKLQTAQNHIDDKDASLKTAAEAQRKIEVSETATHQELVSMKVKRDLVRNEVAKLSAQLAAKGDELSLLKKEYRDLEKAHDDLYALYEALKGTKPKTRSAEDDARKAKLKALVEPTADSIKAKEKRRDSADQT